MKNAWTPMSAGLVALLLASAPQWAAGSKIYRCGPDGREYSQAPCKDGQLVNADDPRSEAQRRAAAATATAKREEQSTDKMTRERHAREGAASKEVAINIGPAKPPAPSASAARAKPAKAKPAARAASGSAAAQR